jgi:predicted phosphoribosyltransferase
MARHHKTTRSTGELRPQRPRAPRKRRAPAAGFATRTAGGEALARLLAVYAHRPDVLVLALPRGGVPVAAAVAKALRVPLDVLIVHKLGVPGQEELAMGAVASGGGCVLNEEVVAALHLPATIMDAVIAEARQELARREQLYRGDCPTPAVRGRSVILVDDGLATGASMRAAVLTVRPQQPARIVVAVPIAAADTCEALRAEVEELVCVQTPEPFSAVGQGYQDFSPLTDAEVCALLAQTAPQNEPPPGRSRPLPDLGCQPRKRSGRRNQR